MKLAEITLRIVRLPLIRPYVLSMSGRPSRMLRRIQSWKTCTPLRSSVFSSLRKRSAHLRAQKSATSGRCSSLSLAR